MTFNFDPSLCMVIWVGKFPREGQRRLCKFLANFEFFPWKLDKPDYHWEGSKI